MRYKEKFKWYLSENDGWHHLFQQQAEEIPELEKKLTNVTAADKAEPDKVAHVKKDFGKQLAIQHEQMKNINNDIENQQRLLISECENDNEYNGIDAYCTQDKLRERIREIEKSYMELKFNFMTYLSTIL